MAAINQSIVANSVTGTNHATGPASLVVQKGTTSYHFGEAQGLGDGESYCSTRIS